MRGLLSALLFGAALLQGCSRREDSSPVAPAPARPSDAPVSSATPSGVRVTLVDAQDRPLQEARLAHLPASAFDAEGKLRDGAAASSPDRLRIRVEDPGSGAPAEVRLSAGPSEPPRVLPLTGPLHRRETTPILLTGDREDAGAARGTFLLATVGGTLEIRYRDVVTAVRIGPAAVHEIPVRFVVAGSMPGADVERAADLRLAQANAVWEPFGRRFTRGPIVRLGPPGGLFLVRGRAAGADGQGRPSRSGVRIDGRDVSVPATWRNDGAPVTPKAAARALAEKIARPYQVELFDGLLAGDREAVVVRVRRRDGTPATVERLADGADVSQAVEPLGEAGSGIEAAPSPATLTLDEFALLACGRGAPSDGIDLFLVPELRSLQARPAFKVYPDGVFPGSLSGSLVVAAPVLDGSGRYPYALARALGELLLPPGVRPGPEDTLFADPLSEAPGVAAHKRVTPATVRKIAERGRGLAGKNDDKK